MKTFVLIWLILLVICALEAYFTVPCDKELDKEIIKRKKRIDNEHKSTS